MTIRATLFVIVVGLMSGVGCGGPANNKIMADTSALPLEQLQRIHIQCPAQRSRRLQGPQLRHPGFQEALQGCTVRRLHQQLGMMPPGAP